MIIDTARYITQHNPNVMISGSTALSLLLKHRMPSDIDVWNVNDIKRIGLNLSKINRINKYLTKAYYKNIRLDLLKLGHPYVRVLYPPVYVDMVRITSIEDMAAFTIHMLVRPIQVCKRSAFYDLYFLLLEYPLSEILDEFFKHYPEFEKIEVLTKIIDFNRANNQQPVLIKCCLGWNEVQEKITDAVIDYATENNIDLSQIIIPE
ncbi:MAG: hypothetical protein K9H26_10750 [Prolixibacteraceae bacterium]|nr:hypothetical protein [Prolixibacteraceae bacterium]